MSILLRNVDKKTLETEFSSGICRPTGDKWQSKTLFLAIFDTCLLIVKSGFDCRLPGVRLKCTYGTLVKQYFMISYECLHSIFEFCVFLILDQNIYMFLLTRPSLKISVHSKCIFIF